MPIPEFSPIVPLKDLCETLGARAEQIVTIVHVMGIEHRRDGVRYSFSPDVAQALSEIYRTRVEPHMNRRNRGVKHEDRAINAR